MDPEPLQAVVLEALDAGPYRYLRIASPAGEAWWVGLDKGSAPGDAVRLQAIGRATGFRSARLGRGFEVPVFGIVKPL